MPRPKKAATEPAPEGLVAVVKGAEVLWIHPTTLQSHKDAGWKLLEQS